MTWTYCLKSLIDPFHNEFVNIWVYIVFALYFWVQSFLILSKSSVYEFNNDDDYYFMFVGTVGIALSLTATAVYLTFYSIGEKEQQMLESYNYMGLLIFCYSLTFCFVASEDATTPVYFYVCFFTVIILGVNLVLVQYDIGRLVSFWCTLAWIGLMFLVGLIICNKHQLLVFFLPMLVEGLLLGLAILLVAFRAPERWFLDNRFIQLYCNSYIIYTILFINFCFEVQNILYLTLKLNSGNLSDDETWWKLSNIYWE